MNEKKNVAIVFGFTQNYTFAVACVMMDLRKYSKEWISEVVILYDKISDNQKNILNSILPCRFIKYDFPIKDSSKFDRTVLNYFSKMVFSKYECLKLLNEYKNVVWLDYDIVITQDISELVNFYESGIKMMQTGDIVLAQFIKPIEEYDMKTKGFSTGTFVLQDHLKDYNRMYDFCYEMTEKYASSLNYPEQAIFDILIQEFNLKPFKLDKKIYCVHPNDVSEQTNAKIIHSYGSTKFWNGSSNKNWNINYERWVALGGDKYRLNNFLIKKNISRLLKTIGLYENVKKIILKLLIK